MTHHDEDTQQPEEYQVVNEADEGHESKKIEDQDLENVVGGVALPDGRLQT